MVKKQCPGVKCNHFRPGTDVISRLTILRLLLDINMGFPKKSQLSLFPVIKYMAEVFSWPSSAPAKKKKIRINKIVGSINGGKREKKKRGGLSKKKVAKLELLFIMLKMTALTKSQKLNEILLKSEKTDNHDVTI